MDKASEPHASKTTSTPLLLTIAEVGEALRISRWSVYQLINKGRLKAVHIDRRRLVAAADLTAFVKELRSEGGNDAR